MAKIAPSLRLTPDEIDGIMRTQARLCIATIGPGADINLTPMTFGWAGGQVYIFGRGQKVANLRRDGRATVLVDLGDAWRELKGVMMRGKARVLETAEDEAGDAHLPEAQRNLGEKHGLGKPYQASASGRSRRWIVFTPERVVSWNNERLP